MRVARRRTEPSALESRTWRAAGARSCVALTVAASASRGVARRRTPGGPDGWLLALVVVAACGGAPRHEAPPPRTGMATGVQRGLATFYGAEQQGGPTASGERFDRNKLTAAHRTLPLGTRVRVTNARNGRSVEVRINDRGPYGHGRIIDLSEAAARRLDMIDAGVVPVTVEVIGDGGRR
jgi:rare lipoprotein A